MFKRLIIAGLAVGSVGCATVMNDSNQPIRVETKTQAGASVTGADCSWTNDKGSGTFRSGESPMIRRSGGDLDITCKHPQNADAKARAISRANAGLAGNIIIGGGIGAIIDHSKGTAYTYPTWLQMIFGQTLTFDRSQEAEGKPVAPAATPAAQ